MLHDVAGTLFKRTFRFFPPLFHQMGRTQYQHAPTAERTSQGQRRERLAKARLASESQGAVVTKRGDQCRDGIVLRGEQGAFEARNDEGISGLGGGSIERYEVCNDL